MVEFFSFNFPTYICALILSYLLGSVMFGLVLTKLAGLGDPRSIGVSTKPGGMLFTVIPFAASSIASALVKPMTPPFDAA